MNVNVKALAVCVWLALCPSAFAGVDIRYRLSLDLQLDGTVQTTSTVIEISYPLAPDMVVDGGMFRGYMHGSAPTLNLGDKGLVFIVNIRSLGPKPLSVPPAALRPGKTTSLWTLPLAAFGLPTSGLPSTMAKLITDLKSDTKSVDVPIELLPMTVRFRDINDPLSIEEIDPADLAATFGDGVKLLHAKIEITSDSITPMPATWPKWLVEAKDLGFPMVARLTGKKPSKNLWATGFKGD